jgi:hypothetical protein
VEVIQVATEYEAVVRASAPGVSAVRHQGVVDLIRQALPEGAAIDATPDGEGLALTVALRISGADASNVQLEALDIVQEALRHAGLSEEAARLDDVSVHTAS